MNRIKLKRGGCRRRKALLGADGAVQAAATLAAAAITSGATAAAAIKQAKSVTDSAQTQAQALEAQNTNNNNLQKESIEFTRSQNQETRQQQQDIQTTLQMLAGQQNMNDRLRSQKVQAKYGRRCRLEKGGMQQPFYGGASPFKVTDGGGALPLQTDNFGNGLYELIGNDHEHYHKTRGGKYKSGVGIKLPTGEVVEGEGNQNSNNGELLYVTPNDALFISKHSIGGFNPAKAVKQGLHPQEAYLAQEVLKQMYGLNDDGSKKKNKSKSKKKVAGGYSVLDNTANAAQSPINAILPTAGGVAYLVNDKNSSPVAKYGTRRKLKSGFGVPFNEWTEEFDIDDDDYLTTSYAQSMSEWLDNANNKNLPSFNFVNQSYWNAYNALYNTDKDRFNEVFSPEEVKEVTITAPKVNKSNKTSAPDTEPTVPGSSNNDWARGALYSTIGNIGGAAINTIGNIISSNALSKAYNKAGQTLANAYGRLKTIDPNLIQSDDYKASHAIAAIRDANYRNTAMRERVRRDAEIEIDEMNKNTLSSAVRQQRTAKANAKRIHSLAEIAEQEMNMNEQVRQGNMERITQTSQFNAAQYNQSRKDFTAARLALAQYNNDIENTKITGAAQAISDAMTQSSSAKATGLQSSMNAIGSALSASGNAFASAYDANLNHNRNLNYALIGADTDNQVTYLLNDPTGYGNRSRAYNLWNTWKSSTNTTLKGYAKSLAEKYNFI